MQKRSHSFYEALTNVAVGIAVSGLITYYILPVWGFEPRIVQALEITAVYTLASVVRSYIVRRAFNAASQ
jgi:hypothetical protein